MWRIAVTIGLVELTCHLSERLVVENDIVAAGEPIGLGGSTGRSTGPHLHFETRYMGKPFDPERVINFNNGTLRDTLLVNAVTASTDEFDAVYDKYFQDYLDNGGQAIIDERAAKLEQYYGYTAE